MWSAYSEAKKTQVHQEALRGSVPEAVNQQVKEGKERMETLKAELHLLSFYMCRDEPEFVEEEIEIKSGFEGLSITTFDNTTTDPSRTVRSTFSTQWFRNWRNCFHRFI